ncbi:hypothetical protein AB5I41_09180 [Sphingomonas sp. MMS24-JH45]
MAPMQAKLNSAASAMAERDHAAADATLELVAEEARTTIATHGRATATPGSPSATRCRRCASRCAMPPSG